MKMKNEPLSTHVEKFFSCIDTSGGWGAVGWIDLHTYAVSMHTKTKA